jgi:hypothetical protein
LLPRTITSWEVLETSFVEKFIPNVFNVVSHPPFPIWTQNNEANDFEKKSNKRMENFTLSHTTKNENENFNFQEKDINLSYTPYEGILSSKIKNEIEEPPLNAQEDFNQHTHMEEVVTNDENSEEH